jgi:hypothetical protein
LENKNKYDLEALHKQDFLIGYNEGRLLERRKAAFNLVEYKLKMLEKECENINNSATYIELKGMFDNAKFFGYPNPDDRELVDRLLTRFLSCADLDEKIELDKSLELYVRKFTILEWLKNNTMLEVSEELEKDIKRAGWEEIDNLFEGLESIRGMQDIYNYLQCKGEE